MGVVCITSGKKVENFLAQAEEAKRCQASLEPDIDPPDTTELEDPFTAVLQALEEQANLHS